MRILLTNDDGVHSPGLRKLHEGLRDLAKLTVVAPDRERSAVAHSFSMYHPVRAWEVETGITMIDGTPTDCVMFAVLGQLEEKPDLVISGINMGPNMGDDVTYSGTVSAALEGTMLGVPSVAMSLNLGRQGEPEEKEKLHIETGVVIARELAGLIGENGLAEDVFLNVNVPNIPVEKVEGVEITRLGKRIYRDRIIKRRDPQGREYYWIGGESPSWVPEDGTDFSALERNRVSITPITFRLTAVDAIERLKKWRFRLNGRRED
jgi:5'-nucleotidase